MRSGELGRSVITAAYFSEVFPFVVVASSIVVSNESPIVTSVVRESIIDAVHYREVDHVVEEETVATHPGVAGLFVLEIPSSEKCQIVSSTEFRGESEIGVSTMVMGVVLDNGKTFASLVDYWNFGSLMLLIISALRAVSLTASPSGYTFFVVNLTFAGGTLYFFAILAMMLFSCSFVTV